MKKLVLGFLIISIMVTGCYYDSEEDLYGTLECTTTDVTYSGVVTTILENNCYRCHDAANNFGGITLEGYDNLKFYVDSGQLIGTIKHEDGFSEMPKGAPSLLDCEIAKIQKWVDDGAPDN